MSPHLKDDYTITIVPSNSSSEANEIGDNPFWIRKLKSIIERYTRHQIMNVILHLIRSLNGQRRREQNVRKLNYRVALAACLLFVGLQIDREIFNRQSAIICYDLALTTNEYNLGNTLFYSCFLLAEVPSQLISKVWDQTFSFRFKCVLGPLLQLVRQLCQGKYPFI